jgi:hypothetical protein
MDEGFMQTTFYFRTINRTEVLSHPRTEDRLHIL